MKDFTFETVQIFESVLWPKIRMCNPVDAASFHSQLGGTEEVFGERRRKEQAAKGAKRDNATMRLANASEA